MRCKCFVFFIILSSLHYIATAQIVNDIPAVLVTRELPFIGTSFFMPDSNKIMVLQKGIGRFYNINGKESGHPFVIHKKMGDVLHPRISTSGKLVAFYKDADDFMGDGKIFVFNRDSGDVVGSYKVPGFSKLERLRFTADSMLQYFVDLTDFSVCFAWNFRQESVKRFTLTKDSLHQGDYDISFYKKRGYVASRYGDTVVLVTVNLDQPDQHHTGFHVTKSISSTIQAQFSHGYPYLILSDAGLQQTNIYKGTDSSLKQVRSLPDLPEIIAAAANEKNCYILYRDSSQGNRPYLQLLDVENNTTMQIPIPASLSKNYIVNIYPDKDVLTASHAVNGTIIAIKLSSGKIIWTFSPPVEKPSANTMQHDSLDSKLFKVLIKQGSNDVNQWYFNAGANHFYLVKNQNKLVTVDADAKCAIRWEYFYRDNNRITETALLPGFRYLYYTEERWEKDELAMVKGLDDKMEKDEDVRKKDQLYPYACRVYDRALGRDVFSMLSASETSVKILNDSLIAYWVRDEKFDGGNDSLLIHNLNSAASFTIKVWDGFVRDCHPLFYNNRFYYFISTLEDELLLINDQGKQIFRQLYKGDMEPLRRIYPVKGSSAFFYLDAVDGKEGMQFYQLSGDSVKWLKKIGSGMDILAVKATETQCYVMYKKTITRKNGDIIQYRLGEIISGTDRLIDSVLYNDEKNISGTEIFPGENYYLQNENNVITWHDMNTGTAFKDFGRNESSIVSLVYSADGRYLAAANPEGKVMLWDLGTGKETKTLKVDRGGYITKLAFSGDSKWLAASSGDIWETASGKNVVSVTDRTIWDVNSIDFSLDGTRIISGGACVISWDASDGSKIYYQQEPRQKDMDTTKLCWNRFGCLDPRFPFMVHSTAFHPNSRDFVVGNVSGLIQKWNTENKKLAASKYLPELAGQENKVYDIKYSRDGKFVIALQQQSIYKLDGNTLEVLDSLILPDAETVLAIDMSYDEKYFGCISSRNNQRIVQLRNLSDLSVAKEFYAEGASFNQLSFSPNKKHAATASEDGFCTIWDITSGQPALYLNTIGDFGNVMVTPDNYYMASKSALDGVSFLKDDNFYSFDQFDLYLNRPDIVLGRLGYASTELINFYRSAYLKRLKKATGNITDSTVKEDIPVLKLTNRKSISAVNTQHKAGLHFTVTDSATEKGLLKIFINGNLVREHSFKGSAAIDMLYTDTVILSQGVNNIEALYVNSASIESRKEKISISHSPSKSVTPAIWFIGIAVSQYKSPEMNLKYPVKDVRDLAAIFKKKYPAIVIDTLIDSKATRENIIALRKRLLATGVNDKVIISFNGHGLLSDSLDWYFATWDIDTKKPEALGLSYAAMENLLRGIPARQKLLLLDACHSGEVDKDKDITFANKETTMEKNVVAPTARGNIVIGKSKAGLQTSFEMMQDLFANLNNGNGATVLSAAGGREYALESDAWKNGVFTYSIIRALKDAATDENADKKISVKELKKAVFNAVKTLTGGRQKPTSRVELLDDWNIW